MAFRRWIRALLHRDAMESEMAAELADHVERYTDDLIAEGTPAAEARRRAAIEFGSCEAAKEECREAVGLRWPDELRRNLAYAVRILSKSPSFTITAFITLALCIGANTAIYSVVDAVLFRPLPYPEPDRLGALVKVVRSPRVNEDDDSHNGATWDAVRDHAATIDAAAYGADWIGVNMSTGTQSRYVRQQRVSAGFFQVLGVAPVIGREFIRAEDVPGGAPVVILSHELWKETFHADPNILGKPIFVRGEASTVVGVMPSGFRAFARADLWTPLRPSTGGEGAGSNYGIITRLRPGRAWADAQSELQVLGREIMRDWTLPPGMTIRLGAMPLQQIKAKDYAEPLFVFWGAVAVVLLIGCVNVSSLLLARGAARKREFGTRLALGSGRASLIRQLLAESLVLACAGALGGIALGYVGVRALAYWAHEYLDMWQTIAIDIRVLAATAAIAVLTSIFFGLYPALEASRVDVRTALAEGGERACTSRSRWARRTLVTAEVALGFALLMTAGLLIEAFRHFNSLRPGFDPEGVYVANVSLQDARYSTAAKVNSLFERTLREMRALPGVHAAGVGLSAPYERPLNDSVTLPNGDNQTTNLTYVTRGYFEALRVPLLAGRLFDERDNASAARVAIVNREFARRYLNGRFAVGMHLDPKSPLEIVGVVEDVQQQPGWGSKDPIAPMPAIFIPSAQTSDGLVRLAHTWFSPKWIVRSELPAQTLLPRLERILQSADPLLPFASFTTMHEVKMRTLAMQRFQAVVMSVLAGLALVLAVVGLYGVVSTSVAERTRELGIRRALGASSLELVRSVVLAALVLAGIGVIAGMGMALASAELLRHFLYGVSATDMRTLLASGALMLAVAAAASVVPALRALRVNPAETLRAE